MLALTVLVTQFSVTIELTSPDEIFFGLSESQGADINWFVLPGVVLLATVIMAGLAVPLGALLTSMPPLKAYSIDILGSMTGVAAFTLLSASGTSPIVWFAVIAVLTGLMGLAAGLRRSSLVTAVSLGGVLVLVVLNTPANQTWSPYYRIDEYHSGGISALDVNGIPHQAMWPLDRLTDPFYEQVYRWFPEQTFENVLIVGAGSGTDVAVALKHGASHVDAVEIDPKIQEIGVRDHPNRPYDDPRVRRINDDGRAFLRRSTDQYDLVIFALPDSLTLVSTSANLRLESFLFTSEAFDEVRDRLSPDGVFVLYNFYREEWLPQKMAAMLADSFGGQPIVRQHGGTAATLAAGPLIDALGGSPPPGEGVDAIDLAGAPAAATDDWPFLYLKDRFIAPYYLAAISIIVGFAVLLVVRSARRSGTSLRQFSPHFFVLGIAFLLLETKSLATFSLLFGTTWIVNALVFFAVLASVLLAIVVNQRVRFRSPAPLYAGPLRLPRARDRPAARVAPARTGLAALCRGGHPRIRTDLLCEPGLQLLLPRHQDGGHGVRVEPAWRGRGWCDRVHGAGQRLRLVARGGRRALRLGLALCHAAPLARRSRSGCRGCAAAHGPRRRARLTARRALGPTTTRDRGNAAGPRSRP